MQKLLIEQHRPHKETEVTSGAPKE